METTQVAAAQEIKAARTDYPVLDVIARRWSPRAFDERPVERKKLLQLLEAARWASSCFNEQPWRFFVATRDEPARYERLLACLNERNRTWAHLAPVLMLTVAKRTFARNGNPNRHAWHDVGLAMGNLLAQATALGLYAHQMAGILPDQARALLQIPDDYDVVTGVALGYLGDPERLPEDRQEAERKPRSRKPLGELVFGGAWGQPAIPGGRP